MFVNEDKTSPVSVRLSLCDGRTLEGSLLLPFGTSFGRVLNSDGPVLEFKNLAGLKSLIVKTAIVEIALTETMVAGAPLPGATVIAQPI